MSLRLIVLVTAIGALTSACTSPQPHAFGIGFPVIVGAALLDSGTPEPDPEAQYQAQPPCIHPGDDEKMHVSGKPRCSRSREVDVSYWTARPDRYRIACKGTHRDYCDENAGMIPHCHGFGKWRFCHAHPGGAHPHDHMHDMEFASNATSEPSR